MAVVVVAPLAVLAVVVEAPLAAVAGGDVVDADDPDAAALVAGTANQICDGNLLWIALRRGNDFSTQPAVMRITPRRGHAKGELRWV